MQENKDFAKMQENKVFSSNITRGQKPLQNNLYDLIPIVPATPVVVKKDDKEYIEYFTPKTDKIYVPKKRARFSKVKTVRDIRNEFETEETTDLSKDLEKQQNILLKRITSGSSRKENTKELARNMLKSEKPISRYSWQMLMNLNPNQYPHPIQYVLWNGRCIRINGSKGGKHKFLCNYDLAKLKRPVKKDKKNRTLRPKKSLLQNSLTVKFKPGPLSRKRFLDDSYQKYNVGNTELVNLPKPGLDIRPKYGVSLEPAIANFVESLRDTDGHISEKWAEYAVSVLGTVKNSSVIQNGEEPGVTFELNYKRNQRRTLMRHDVLSTCVAPESYNDASFLQIEDREVIPEVKTILSEIIDSVEISLLQDKMFLEVGSSTDNACLDESMNTNVAPKEKVKKRYCELDRLDVTVIRLPEVPQDDLLQTCNNAHCSLGCICTSLQCAYNLKQHCGRIECMFECKCDFSKYKAFDSFESDCPELIPGLINLDNELSLKLAKEEHKFHQTVVVTGEKSILLKPERRNWKATKRYRDFYSNMCLKNDAKVRKVLSVVDVKLNCENIEPWCMVHNLYKCFCKGRFTSDVKASTSEKNELDEKLHEEPTCSKPSLEMKRVSNKSTSYSERPNTDRTKKQSISVDSEAVYSDYTIDYDYRTMRCARVKPYKGRKFGDNYYINTNKKIIELEKNDHHLRKKMLSIVNKRVNACDLQDNIVTENNDTNLLQVHDASGDNEEISSSTSQTPTPTTDKQSETEDKSLDCEDVTHDRSVLNTGPNRTKLIAWLESSYKQYKRRLDLGVVKTCLEPPKHGKVALYPWEFILSRYRERKNLFLISKLKPFRIFMAIDGKHNFFENCINIDDIRFADLHKYPVTVKNLLTNATDLKDNFCILCGLSHCWELIGSVTKVTDQKNPNDGEKRLQSFTSEDSNLESPNLPNVHNDLTDISKSKQVSNLQSPHSPNVSISLRDLLKDKSSISKVSNFESSHLPDVSKNLTDISESKQISDLERPHLPNVSKNLTDISKSDQIHLQDVSDQNVIESDLNLESSKWFVMTVENDFSEIQFHNKGFFVKYESIIKAINVARMSMKTVRLSSQKCVEQQGNGPQFGIYAIPNANEYYVFIGPYDKDEPLGIETIKSFAQVRTAKRTRGVWITTKKVDNIKVIDNPQSFMPPTNLHPSKMVPLDIETTANQVKEVNLENSTKIVQERSSSEDSPKKEQPKLVKPIKIRKKGGFYHLAPPALVQQASVTKSAKQVPIITVSKSLQPSHINAGTIQMPPLIKILPNLTNTTLSSSPLLKKCVTVSDDSIPLIAKPIAEIAPQIKIIDVFSESDQNKTKHKKTDGAMFILKPEEINKRLMQNKMMTKVDPPPVQNTETNNSQMDLDIENFLATTVECSPNEDIFVISDEENSNHELIPNHSNWRDVWIECKNSAALGWIRGRKNAENELSFEFPGFKFTEFYSEEEAFSKINQVLSRKIYVPKSLLLEWHVAESEDDLVNKQRLQAEDLGADFVLTKRGLRHKQELMASRSILKAKTSTSTSTSKPATSKSTTIRNEEVDNAVIIRRVMSELEERSKTLDDECEMLMTEMAKKSNMRFSIPQDNDEKVVLTSTFNISGDGNA